MMREDDHTDETAYRRWLDETFINIRAKIGGREDQNGASRDYGRASEQARFGYHMLNDEGDVEFAVTILDTTRRRNVAPIRWRSTPPADAAGSVLKVHWALLPAGRSL